MISDTVRKMIADAHMVAHFGAMFSITHCYEVFTWEEEPALLQEPGKPPRRFHPLAVAAARLKLEPEG